MNQYTTLENVVKYPVINRKLIHAEYDKVVDVGIDLGIEDRFTQEGETAMESFIPDFNTEGV